MPQSFNQKVTNTFIKGLITEANELTFPANASVDELNCDLQRTGSRRRRKSVRLEEGAVSSGTVMSDDSSLTTFVWESVNDQPGLDFLVMHHDTSLHFYELTAASISPYKKGFTIDLTEFGVANTFDITESLVQFSTIKGLLVVVSPAIDAFFVRYKTDTDSLETNTVKFRVRDFDLVGPSAQYFTRIDMSADFDSIENVLRRYDSRNAGWTTDVLNTYDGNFTEPPTDSGDSGYQEPGSDTGYD